MDTQRFGWSLPIGRILGIRVRVHILLIVFTVVELLEGGSLGWDRMRATLLKLGVLWGSVLLHELGHCYAATRIGGRAEHILLWPLGGLAYSDIPRTAHAHFWTSFGGPIVTLAIAAVGVIAILTRGHGFDPNPGLYAGMDWARCVYQVNGTLLLLNLLPIFPLDGGGMARAFLWQKWGFGPATLMAIRVSRVFSILLAIYGFWAYSLWIVSLAAFCYFATEQERVALEMGAGDDTFMGYDFSNGYTSLETSSPRPARRTSLTKRISRWFSSRRAERQARRERDEENELKARVDSLLEKIGREGMAALSDEEREFLNEASKHYRL